MKAFVLEEFDTEPRLRDDLPEPDPGDGQLVVRVQASSVNPVDTGVVAGTLRAFADYEFPVILGRDFAGVVERAGSGRSSRRAMRSSASFPPAHRTSTTAPGPSWRWSRRGRPPPSLPVSTRPPPGPHRSPP